MRIECFPWEGELRHGGMGGRIIAFCFLQILPIPKLMSLLVILGGDLIYTPRVLTHEMYFASGSDIANILETRMIDSGVSL